MTLSSPATVTATFDLIPTPTYALGITKSGDSTGIVTSNPIGINCGAACSASFLQGQFVTLTAAVDFPLTAAFAGWSGGACAGVTATTCSLVISAPVTVNAAFQSLPATNTLSLSKTGSGAGSISITDSGTNTTVSCAAGCTSPQSYSYPSGTTLTLSAAPASSSSFTGWGGDCSGTVTCTVTLSSSRSLTADFQPVSPTTYVLAVNKAGDAASSGTVAIDPPGITCGPSCTYDFPLNQTVTLTASTPSGVTFAGWTSSSGSPGCINGPTCTVTMNAAQTVTATFNTSTYPLTVTKLGDAVASGTVTSDPPGISCGAVCTSTSYPFTAGQVVTLTASADAGATFTGWSGTGCITSPTCTVTMSAPTSVTATFSALPTGNSVVISNPVTWTGLNNGLGTIDNLTITSSGSISPAPGETTLQIVVSGTITIDAGGAIDVSATGCAAGTWWDPAAVPPACTGAGASVYYAGGSYGGQGGLYNGSNAPNPTYGDPTNPNEPGSGGATGSNAGGGLLRLTATTLTLNGQLLANGQSGYNGAGSGGGIYVNVTTLAGAGSIHANGGASINGSGYGGGGGGRIAVLADTSSLPTSTITALAGTGSPDGGAGTVFTSTRAGLNPLLVVDAGRPALVSATTPLAGLPTGATLLVKGGARVVNGTTLPPLGTLTLAGQSSLSLAAGSNTFGAVSLDASTLSVAGTATTPFTVPSLTLTNSSRLTSPPVTSPSHTGLFLSVSGTVTVDSTSTIDVSATGCAAGTWWDPAAVPPACTGAGASVYYAGGSYGGQGGLYNGSNAPNPTYGDPTNPNEPGSGGATGSNAGGGLLRLTATTLTLNGQLLANGQSGYNGAGSGGGIYVNVTTLAGAGSIHANGGASINGYGGGGGGRIAVLASNLAGFAGGAGALFVNGGAGSPSGTAGTTYMPGSSFLLTISRAGDAAGSGTVTSSPSGLSCGPTCTYSFVASQPVTLTASTVYGSQFDGWSGSTCNGVTATTCVLTLSAATTVTATFSQATQTVIYSRLDGTVWFTTLDGSQGAQLTTGFWPRLSPDGRYLALLRGGTTSTPTLGDIYVRDLLTGSETRAFQNMGDHIVNFGWTADSAQIVFDYWCDINRISRDGSGFVRLVSGSVSTCYNDAPSSRASDGKIAYHNIQSGYGIVLANADGTGSQVIAGTQPNDWVASWSPDGQWLSFVRGPANANNRAEGDIWKIQPDGMSPTCLTCGLGSSRSFYPAAAWTADGTRVVAAGQINGVAGLYSIAADGSGAVQISIAPGSAPDWSGSVSAAASLSATQLTVVKTGNAAADSTITSTLSGISCGSTCTSSFVTGQPVTLTASPAYGATFDGWSGCTAVSGTNCSLTLSSPTTVIATFSHPTLAVSSAWNPANDWRHSPNQLNPSPDSYGNSAVWYFLYTTGTLHDAAAYRPMPSYDPAFNGDPNQEKWYYGDAPYWGHNESGTAITSICCGPWPANTIRTHPGANGVPAILGWKSPVSGTVSIAGSISDSDGGSGDGILWFVDKNGTTIAGGGFDNGLSQTLAGGTGGAGLSAVGVVPGDVIYLIIHPNGAYDYDTTHVNYTITWTSTSQPVSATVTTPATYRTAVLGDSPAGYWRMDDTPGSTTAADATGGNHPGTVSGAVTFGTTGAPLTGPSNANAGAARFTDGGNYISIPRLVQDSFTLEAWVSTTFATNCYPCQFWQGASIVNGEVGGVTTDFGLTLNGGHASFGTGAADTTLNSVSIINDGAWHHVVAVRDITNPASPTLLIYVDGRLDASWRGGASLSTAALTAPSALTIGNFAGAIDEVAVYPTALTPTQIRAHYAARATTNPAYTLTVAKDDSYAAGSVTSFPAGISCGAVCSYDYAAGQVVTLTASAPSSTVFAGWSGGSCSGTGTCAVTLNTATTVTATFNAAAPPNTLYVSSSGTDTGDCQTSASPCRQIAYAVGVAPSGYTISVATGTYQPGIAPFTTQTLSIVGAGSDTVIDGNNSGRPVRVDSGATLSLANLVITRGAASTTGGAGVLNNGTLTLSYVTVTANTMSSAVDGAGIKSTGSLTVSSSAITGNASAYHGGGLSLSGTATITNTTISGNKATGGSWNGGGMLINSGASVALTNVVVTGNMTIGGSGNGGGIYSEGTLTMTGGSVTSNSASGGYGGGLSLWGPATLTDVDVSSNTGSSVGGILINSSSSSFTLDRVLISDNQGASGNTNTGGLWVNAGPTTLTNVTLSGNRSSSGTANLKAGASTTLTNVTIYNSAADATYSMFGTSANITMVNTLLANAGGGTNCSAAVTSLGYNLSSDNSSCSGSTPTGVQFSATLLTYLGPLANNGGNTKTHALLSTSPAIDAGSNAYCRATDQRGVARPIDGDGISIAVCDIGAYEYGS